MRQQHFVYNPDRHNFLSISLISENGQDSDTKCFSFSYSFFFIHRTGRTEKEKEIGTYRPVLGYEKESERERGIKD